MLSDFKAVLARVQTDYAFYVLCQSDPASALADYTLSPDERSAIADPERLAAAMRDGTEARLPSISIQISGTHDWVNRAAPEKKKDVDELLAREVESVKRAKTDEERRQSTLRLIQLLG